MYTSLCSFSSSMLLAFLIISIIRSSLKSGHSVSRMLEQRKTIICGLDATRKSQTLNTLSLLLELVNQVSTHGQQTTKS